MTPALHVALAEHFEYKIGETVYFPANAEKRGIVTAIMITATGGRYGVLWCDLTERWHSQIEICREKPCP